MKKIFSFYCISFFMLAGISFAQNFRVPVQVKDGCSNSITIWLGVDPAATSGFNVGIDTLAPPPPPGGFDARYRWQGEDYLTDIRENTITQKQFQMIYQKDGSCGLIKLYWNKNHIDSLGTFFMTDNITGTLWGPFDMKTTDSLIISADLVYIQNSLRILVTPYQWMSPPSPPSNCTAGALNQTTVLVAWTDNSDNEQGFKLERRIPPSSTWNQIAIINANVTTYQDTGLSADMSYCYRVRAYNTGGNSAYSNEVCAVTYPNLPGAPSNLSASVLNNSCISMSWTDNSVNETGFIIQRKRASGSAFLNIDTVSGNLTSFNDSTISQGFSYNYRVCAYNVSGNSGFSNTAYITSVLPAPINLSAQFITGPPYSVLLSWNDASNNELGFKIQRDTTGLGNFYLLDSVAANITGYSDTHFVIHIDTFYYRIFAFSEDTVSAFSNISDLMIPVEMISFTASLINNKILLMWSTATETNNRGFDLERKTEDEWETISFISGRGTTTEKTNYSFTDVLQNIRCNGIVKYRLKQIDFSGSYKYSEIIEVQVIQGPAEYILYQNYPNPFNPVTKIKYMIPEQCRVSLSVYNTLGQKIAVLADEVKDPGIYEAEFISTEKGSGIYFYRIETDKYSKTLKMTFVK